MGGKFTNSGKISADSEAGAIDFAVFSGVHGGLHEFATCYADYIKTLVESEGVARRCLDTGLPVVAEPVEINVRFIVRKSGENELEVNTQVGVDGVDLQEIYDRIYRGK